MDPREVQAALLGIDGITEALVVGVPDAEWGQAVVAYVVGDPPSRGLGWIKGELRGVLASFKLPKRCDVVDALPPDGVGSIARRGDAFSCAFACWPCLSR